MICNCALAGTAACNNCPSHKWEEEGRFPSKVFFAYGVDAVEVVRCKDCRWWDAKEDGYKGYCHAAKHGYYSRNWEIGIYRLYGPDFFCADGERQGEEDDCD